MNLQLLHVMTQAVTHLPLTKEAQVLSQASLYGICGEQSGTGISFSLSISVFPCQHRSTNVPYSLSSLNNTIQS